MGDDPRLPRTGTRENQERPLRREYRFALWRIEVRQIHWSGGFNHSPQGSKKKPRAGRANLGFTSPVASPNSKVPRDSASAKAIIATLDRRHFLEELDLLGQTFARDPGNPGSYACSECERCANCMFCVSCESCFGCTHCQRCKLCNNCTHCLDSTSLNACAYCVHSEHCANSAYLFFCRNLSDCTYCFGCVGLSKKDFHILNVSFSRQEYFELTARLKKEFGIKLRA